MEWGFEPLVLLKGVGVTLRVRRALGQQEGDPEGEACLCQGVKCRGREEKPMAPSSQPGTRTGL